MAKGSNRYAKIIEKIFLAHFKRGMKSFEFERNEIKKVADELGIDVPKNIGDLIYSFRYRANLPEAVQKQTPKDKEWVIIGTGASKYRFELRKQSNFEPNPALAETKVPDATPGIVSMYALSDEQALLAKIRYNRLIDIFTAVTCYSIQNHLRTQVKGVGQVETDEIYIGIDRRGAHYVVPVQAKGGTDRLGVIQIEQDMAMCKEKFPALICRPIAAQFMVDGKIALFEFEDGKSGIKIAREKHYLLVPSEEIEETELISYANRVDD